MTSTESNHNRPKFSELAQNRDFPLNRGTIKAPSNPKDRAWRLLHALLALAFYAAAIAVVALNWDNQRNDPYQTIPESEVQGR